MQYDPIKRSLGGVFNQTPFLRKTFYKLLDLLLLRTWHIDNELKAWMALNPNKTEVFDAGSGYGQYSYKLSGLNPKFNILAVDVKEEQVEDCNIFFAKVGKTNVKFEVGDLTQYNKPNAFDLALSVDVMEHILEDVEVFKNIYTSLKPGGMLLISTPSDQGGSDVHEGEEGSFIEEHVRDGYAITDIEAKLKLAGFTGMVSRYAYGKFGTIAWRMSMKWPIQLLGVSKLFFVLIPFYYAITYPICYVLNYLDANGENPTGTGLIVRAYKA